MTRRAEELIDEFDTVVSNTDTIDVVPLLAAEEKVQGQISPAIVRKISRKTNRSQAIIIRCFRYDMVRTASRYERKNVTHLWVIKLSTHTIQPIV